MGLKELAVLSNEEGFGNPQFFRALENKLAEAQRKLSRRKKGSSNWNKQRIKVARIHEDIRNARKLPGQSLDAYCQKPRHHCRRRLVRSQPAYKPEAIQSD
ncbi:hypothetical protein J2Z22_002802 [Paenibacillus forsythiae]|uniref:Probable transposase IS891/IS1136/IS1341 domain-containing protein n=1 Tax=Paenibacillus forsythiae TaxID=365616 RepID=A0ABU3H919_9BACL|nr:hypothetical protein [Paenibacillus forsythiae]